MGITKFTSAVVFTFGILLLLVIAASFVMQWTAAPVENGPKARTIPPKCDMPALNVGTVEQFAQRLDSIFNTGGIDAVREYVEKEFVPGRTIIITSALAGNTPSEMALIDRELRRCDTEGAALLGVAPVLQRATATASMNDDVQLSHQSRLQLREPFYLTTWWVQRN